MLGTVEKSIALTSGKVKSSSHGRSKTIRRKYPARIDRSGGRTSTRCSCHSIDDLYNKKDAFCFRIGAAASLRTNKKTWKHYRKNSTVARFFLMRQTNRHSGMIGCHQRIAANGGDFFFSINGPLGFSFDRHSKLEQSAFCIAHGHDRCRCYSSPSPFFRRIFRRNQRRRKAEFGGDRQCGRGADLVATVGMTNPRPSTMAIKGTAL